MWNALLEIPREMTRWSARVRFLVVSLVALAAVLLGSAERAFADDPVPPPGTPAPTATPGAAPTTSAAVAAAEGEAKEETPKPAPDTIDAEKLVPDTVVSKPPPPGLLRGPLGLCKRPPCLSSFWWDTDVRLHLRTFYFDRHNVNGSDNEAWAFGGWLEYTSGWLANVFQVGATVFTSQPLYAPEDRDGTSLLAPGQEEITVLGEAFASVRWCDYAVLTGFRQTVNSGYIGPQDNRMIPNTFEGVTLHGKVCSLAYDTGYLWDIKPRNLDEFIPMGQQAGVTGSDQGTWYGSLLWTPSDSWELFAGDYYTPDILNIGFLRAKWVHELNCCDELNVGAQYTDERSVEDELLGSFQTWNVGVGARIVWGTGWRLGAAFHATGEDANIRSPYGSWPGYLSLIEIDFDRANEKAVGAALRYDFGQCRGFCAPGLAAILAYAYGWDRINPATGAALSDTHEVDLDVTWDVPRVKGLQLRFRNAYVEAGGPDTGIQFRLIANWEIDLF